jgi:hypothetical protein
LQTGLDRQANSIGKSLAADQTRSISDICETLKISSATYYRYIIDGEGQYPRTPKSYPTTLLYFGFDVVT